MKATIVNGSFQNRGQNIDLEKPRRANPALVEQIVQYDKALIVFHDRSKAKYGIARITPTGFHVISLWEDPVTKVALPLDNRLLDAIRSWDMRPTRVGAPRTANEHCDREDQDDIQRDEKSWDRFDDDIGHITRSNKRQLARLLEGSR